MIVTAVGAHLMCNWSLWHTVWYLTKSRNNKETTCKELDKDIFWLLKCFRFKCFIFVSLRVYISQFWVFRTNLSCKVVIARYKLRFARCKLRILTFLQFQIYISQIRLFFSQISEFTYQNYYFFSPLKSYRSLLFCFRNVLFYNSDFFLAIARSYLTI